MRKLEIWCEIYFGLSLCCKKGCTAAGNSLVSTASYAYPPRSYAHLIASMTIRFDSGGSLLAIGSAGFRV
jgi:hypothetical protein